MRLPFYKYAISVSSLSPSLVRNRELERGRSFSKRSKGPHQGDPVSALPASPPPTEGPVLTVSLMSAWTSGVRRKPSGVNTLLSACVMRYLPLFLALLVMIGSDDD